MKKIYLIISLYVFVSTLFAEQIELLKEVKPGPSFGSIEEPPAFIGDSIMIFNTDGDTTGRELWRTDGTPNGTFMVKDIYPGMYDETTPNESAPKSFCEMNGEVYFTAFAKDKGYEFFKTDGTAEGTVLIKDIYPDGVGGVNTTGEFIVFKNKLYFSAYSDKSPKNNYNKELWVSDGTTAGTILLKDINAQSYSSPHDFTIMGDSIYFIAYDSSYKNHLWLTDGTTDGTVHVEDTLTAKSVTVQKIIGQCNNRLYFAANDDIHGNELWVTDGTTEGTILLKDLHPEPGYDGLHYDKETVVFNNELYFVATDNTHGIELWKTDGTSTGTKMVADINHTNSDSTADAYIKLYYEFDGKLMFTAKDSTNTYNIWSTDGSENGTKKSNITGISQSTMPQIINKVNGALYFAAVVNNDSISNQGRLCSIESLNEAATYLQGKDFYYNNLSVMESFVVNNTLIFRADFKLGNGYELYRVVESGKPQSIEQADKGNTKLQVYPNPTNGILWVKSDIDINRIDVFSTSGQKAKSFYNTRQIDLSGLKTGIYYLQIKDAKGHNHFTKTLKK